MQLTQRAGVLGGILLGPVAALGAAVRHSRLLHPRGVVYLARVEPVALEGPLRRLGERLAGPALVRLSGAWWKKRELPDVLGLAIRFHEKQDLLLATLRRLAPMLLAPATTNQHDFLANDYYAASPFEVEGLGRTRFRAVPMRAAFPGPTREDKLDAAVRAEQALVSLEVNHLGGYEPFARVILEQRADLDQRELAFDPFRDGEGIRPVGFIHGLRRLTYPMARAPRHA